MTAHLSKDPRNQVIGVLKAGSTVNYITQHFDCSRQTIPVILLPAHPTSFAHNFVSGLQSFYFIESQDAIVLQTSL